MAPLTVKLWTVVCGGRLSHTFPLIFQSFGWEHGVYMAATMGSEATAAAVDQAAAQVQETQTELDRLVIRALVDGEVLQVNVRPGEFVGAPPSQALVVLGNVTQLHVRVDVDEYDIPRFIADAPARATLKGQPNDFFPLRFVRLEPYVVPKKSLTGDNTERVDTRVLQVIYAFDPQGLPAHVGQQVDAFIEATPIETVAAPKPPVTP